MKKIILILLLGYSNCFATIDYINTYFPENSIVRKAHNAEPHGTGWFGFDSDRRVLCDRLNSIFFSLEHREHSDYSLGYLHVYDYLETAIREIAQNQDEKTIQLELDWAWELKIHLDKKVTDKYEQTEEYRQAIEREQRLIAIRKAIQQKDL